MRLSRLFAPPTVASQSPRLGSARGVFTKPLLTLSGLLCVALLGFAPRAAQAVPINITYTDAAGQGFNDPKLGQARRNCFEAVASQWSQTLGGTIPVVVTATFKSLGGDSQSATLGSAGPNDYMVNAKGLQPGVYYPEGLANQLAGQDLNGASPEIGAQFNSDVDNGTVLGGVTFYYGTDGNPPANTTDFYSTALHELCHGLGFIDGTSSDGSYTLGGPDIYDTFEATGTDLNAPRLTALSQTDRAAAIISNALYFAGPQTNAAGGGVNARLYAPNPYEDGSSVSHLNQDTYAMTINALMVPTDAGVIHQIGPVDLGVMKDIGWGSSAATSTPTPAATAVGGNPTPTPQPTARPTPTPTPIVRPANDNFANAQAIGGKSGQVKGTNVNATKEANEPIHSPDSTDPGGASIWYAWTAPGTGTVTFTTAGSDFDTVLAIYTGSSVNTLTALAKNDNASTTATTSSVTANVTQGTLYYIAVDGHSNLGQGGVNLAMGNVVLNWSFAGTVSPTPTPKPGTTPTPRPTPAPTPKPGVTPTPVVIPYTNNDDFKDAQILKGQRGYAIGYTGAATKEPGEPYHAGNRGGKSIWYRFQAPTNGTLRLTTVGSHFDTLLAVYTGTSVNRLTPVIANDNAPGLLASRVDFNVTGGTIYQIAVDGKNATADLLYADSGAVVLNFIFQFRIVDTPDVKLSTGSASAATGLVALRFASALDETAASDPASYSVMVNGTVVAAESAAYAAANHTVTLALSESALRFGDKVTVTWRLNNAKGSSFSGHVGPLTAR